MGKKELRDKLGKIYRMEGISCEAKLTVSIILNILLSVTFLFRYFFR